MIVDERPAEPEDLDPHCEGCGRSIITRFGGMPFIFCESCDREWHLLLKAGRQFSPAY